MITIFFTKLLLNMSFRFKHRIYLKLKSIHLNQNIKMVRAQTHLETNARIKSKVKIKTHYKNNRLIKPHLAWERLRLLRHSQQFLHLHDQGRTETCPQGQPRSTCMHQCDTPLWQSSEFALPLLWVGQLQLFQSPLVVSLPKQLLPYTGSPEGQIEHIR